MLVQRVFRPPLAANVLLILSLLHVSEAHKRPFDLTDCPAECLCDQVQPESFHFNNKTTFTVRRDAQLFNDKDTEPGLDSDGVSLHALCMIRQSSGFKNVEDYLPSDTAVLKIVYASQTEQYQLNASSLARFTHLRELHVQSLKSQLLRFSLDGVLPVERLHLEALELIRTEPPTVLDRMAPSLAEMGLSPIGNGNVNEAYQIAREDEEPTNGDVGGADSLTETFELEIVPYEVYKRDLASTSNVSFYGFTNLTALAIHDCQLESLHPDFLYGLERLQRLSLQHNNLKVLPPFAFYGAPNLGLLSLAGNRLLEVSYYSLAGLLELQVLDLSANNISRVSELTFPPFPKLSKLDLRQNPIEYVFDSSFAIANMTRSLFIGSDMVGLQIATPKPFQGLAQMELLEIRNLQMPALHQYLFRGLRTLRTLRLVQGNISFVEYDSFAEMKNLTELYASRCAIGAVSMDAFFGVKRLRIIDLSYNQLAELPVGLFDEQLQLLELYLHGNRLTQLPTDFFRRLTPGVQIVRLIENPWQCSCTMGQWRQAATNRLRVSAPSEGAFPSYVYSNKLTPRCSEPSQGINNRSVYYVIRKNLHCHDNADDTSKVAHRISEMNRRKQQALLLKRQEAAAGGSTIRETLQPIAQPSFENPIPMHGTYEAAYAHLRSEQSLLYQQKRQRLQKKLAHRQRYVGTIPQHPLISNEIEI